MFKFWVILPSGVFTLNFFFIKLALSLTDQTQNLKFETFLPLVAVI